MTDEANQVERYARAKEIFLRVYSLPIPERGMTLQESCGSDPDLLREVEELLSYHEQSGSLGTVSSREEAKAESGREAESGPLPEAIGRFRILRRLGQGAMGVVYLAEDPTNDRQVALKLLHSGTLSEAPASRLRTEAEALRRLDHPGIARFYEVGSFPVDGRITPYLAMEYVRGRPWRDFQRDERATDRGRIQLLCDLCEAVGHAHQQGIVHRDLKAENILVEENGRPRVLDFGLARMTDLDARATTMMTQPGLIMGTLRTMSPEQARGNVRAIDARTDVYALGVIAYELLTGLLPYDLPEDPAEAIAVILGVLPVPAGRLRPSLRGNVEAIIEKALAKDPARRYATAGELAADLRRHLQGKPVAARSLPARVRTLRNRHRRAVLLLVVLAGLSAAVATAVRVDRRRTHSVDMAASASSLEEVYALLEDADRLRHSADAGAEQIRQAGLEYERARHALAGLPSDATTRGLLMYSYWRLGEVAYFQGTMNADPGQLKSALDYWGLANGTQRSAVLPPGLDSTRVLYDNYVRVGTHHPLAGMGLAHATLAFYENPAQHARMSLWCRRYSREIQESLGIGDYPVDRRAPMHAAEDDVFVRCDLLSSLVQLGAVVDSTEYLDAALSQYAQVSGLSRLAEYPSAYAAMLQNWGTAWLERAERSGSKADMDSAEARFRQAIEVRDSRSTHKAYGGPERELARLLCLRARREPDIARKGQDLDQAVNLLELCVQSVSEPDQSVSAAVFRRALADALIDRVGEVGRTGDTLRTKLRGDLARADSLLSAAARVFTPREIPAQNALVEFSLGRLAKLRWQLDGNEGDRKAARMHFSRAREVLPRSHNPALHRRIEEENDLLRIAGEAKGT